MKPFTRAVSDQPRKAREHFHGLREAFPELRAVALFDRLDQPPQNGGMTFMTWRKREIESYLCSRAALETFARDSPEARSRGPMFRQGSQDAMSESLARLASALRDLGKPSPWGGDLKVGDEFLAPLFKSYFGQLGLYNTMPKREFHRLVEYIPDDEIDDEVREKLDVIGRVARCSP